MSGLRSSIFRVLFGLHGEELHLREIQRRTGFALGTVRQDIAKLVQLGVVVRRKDGKKRSCAGKPPVQVGALGV